jgi:hypothetical protein
VQQSRLLGKKEDRGSFVGKPVGGSVSKLTLAEAISDFGSAAKAKLNQGGQPEDQLRNPLEQLFAALSAECGHATGALTLIGEKSMSELRTRPDFAAQFNKALIGFIEVKAPGKGADPRKFKDKHDKEQWDKLKALPNLVYTDGNAVSLWRNGVLVGDIIKFDGDIETSGAKLAAPPSLLPLISDFLSWQPIPPKGPKELAAVAARLCRYLRDEVIEQLGIKNAKLSELKEDWKALLFPDADDARFADGYAQAVTFGLLMAKSRKLTLADGLDDVAKALGKTDTLIGTALRLLTEQDLSLGPSLATMVRVLDVVDWDVIAKGDPEAWLYFYEDFLGIYDNRLRKLTGSYYTPPQVVQTMVRLCDEALRSSKRFGVAQGLASNQVHIADPAMGSGTYLLAILRAIAESVGKDQGEGAVPGAVSDAAKRIYGFEIQFGAYAVAELRLLAEMIALHADGTPGLFVTDTLSDPFADIESGTGIYKEISNSRRAANKIKREQPITVVIGNPPYKEKAKGKGSWIEKGGNRPAPFQDWIPPKDWKVSTHAKHLRNLYVYFWRWAAWKVFEQGSGGRDLQPPVDEALSGMVCYISVAGFLNGPGFQKMRESLRRECDEIWVIHCSPEGQLPKVNTRIFRHHGPLKSIETLLEEEKHGSTKAKAQQDLKLIKPTRYGFRSFDRQWIIPDNRLINRPNPGLWKAFGKNQLYFTALTQTSPKGGAALTATSNIPDLDHYSGKGGRVFSLWKDAAETDSNISAAVLAELAKTYGAPVDPVDVFAYVAALLAHPAYVERFRDDLIQPGLRVPLTADAKLFKEAAQLGREVIWLHTFGERFAEGRPAGPPRVAVNPPTVPKDGAIPSTPEVFPDTIDYDAGARRLKVGTGHIDNVAPEVWAYEVSGKNVLRQWFSYRKRNRERPLIGDKRKPSPLGDIQPDHWLPEYTSELINVLNVLTLLVKLEPAQKGMLDKIIDGPLIPASKFVA